MQELVTYNSQTAIVQLPHTKYVDKVLRSTSYEELMWKFLDAESPSKEISESYAAFSNLKKICLVNASTWLHIGDGAYSRTGSIFAFFSKSLNISIDPALNLEKSRVWRERFNGRIKGIYGTKSKFEDIGEPTIQMLIKTYSDFDKREYSNQYNICCVHAHVNLEEVDKQYPNWTFLYTNPCCKPHNQLFTEKYMKENHIVKIVDKLDMGILSEKRHVVIYKKIKP